MKWVCATVKNKGKKKLRKKECRGNAGGKEAVPGWEVSASS